MVWITLLKDCRLGSSKGLHPSYPKDVAQDTLYYASHK